MLTLLGWPVPAKGPAESARHAPNDPRRALAPRLDALAIYRARAEVTDSASTKTALKASRTPASGWERGIIAGCTRTEMPHPAGHS